LIRRRRVFEDLLKGALVVPRYATFQAGMSLGSANFLVSVMAI
jgi:hypothetical protein